MSDELSVVTLYPSHQPTIGFRSFRLMVEALLAEKVAVHIVCSGELRLEPHPRLHVHQIELPTRMRRGWVFPFLFAICAPLRAWKIVRREKSKALVSSEPSLSSLLVPIRFLTRRPLVTVLEMAPWLARKAKSRSRFSRGFGTVRDYLGLCSSSSILTPSDALAAEVRVRVPFAANRVKSLARKVIFPPEIQKDEMSKPLVDSWRNWLNGQLQRRQDLADEFQLPERWLFISAPSELIGRRSLEILLRALSVIENERVVLIFCGNNPEKNYLEAMAVGLGVYDQLLFADSLNVSEVLAASDLFVLPASRPGNSQVLAEALGCGIAVLASDIDENRELVPNLESLFQPEHVQALAQKLQLLTSGKAQLEALRRGVRESSAKQSETWGAGLRDFLVP